MNKQIFKSNGLMNKLYLLRGSRFYAGFSQSSFGATTTADPNAMQDAKRISGVLLQPYVLKPTPG